jgi:hypothetical protein
MNKHALIPCVLMMVAALCFSGCAVQSQGNKIVISTDYAQMLGEVVDETKMADGSVVTLRRMGDDYSLKFGVFSRMAPLGKLAGGRILNVTKLDNVTNVLLETRTSKNTSCPRYVIVSLSSLARADKWDIPGSCQQHPVRVLSGQNIEAVDFVDGKKMFRYTLQSGKLSRSEANLPKEPTNKATLRRASSSPAPAAAPSSQKSPAISKTNKPSPDVSNARTTSTTSAPTQRKENDNITLPQDIDFGKPQEMKKVSIDLT